jgi:hypothetical protein
MQMDVDMDMVDMGMGMEDAESGMRMVMAKDAAGTQVMHTVLQGPHQRVHRWRSNLERYRKRNEK